MEMPFKKKKHLPSPLLVSTSCSKFKSLYLSCRRHLYCSKTSHHNPIPKNSASLPEPTSNQQKSTVLSSRECGSEGQVAAQMYWERVRRLELELIQLDEWLDNEKKLIDSLNNKNETYSAKFGIEKPGKHCGRTELTKLVEGGYLRNFYVSAWDMAPGRNLAMQVSASAVIPADTGSTMSQVLNQMALMGRDNLIHWLLESMPMYDISSKKINVQCKTSCSEEGFLEAIFLSAIEKLESQVIEALQIQMSGKETVKNRKTWKERDDGRAEECVIQVMLVQVRDPENGYEAVGEIMIAFIEAFVADMEESRFFIKGVHVAGISTGRDEDGRGEFLWCVSSKSCEGSYSGSSPRYVRNPGIFLATQQ
ncbi:hypothetical protein L1049_022518 [Liquidambar formosana]|uniref:PMI1/PMIR1-2 C-terminal domain-containing protein n=1 Tax=Liquidambar formosana TaxID=63359 RepID=A0AAP0RCN0_LIQFO